MRDILFRGKRLDKKDEWVEGGIVHQTDFYGDPVDRYFIIDGTDTDDNIGPAYCVYPDTVGQFTGLTDKNGKKIFEKDVVRFSTPYCLYTAPIVYGNGVWLADNKREASFTLYSIIKLNPEIIGNIYDNPELLEVAE